VNEGGTDWSTRIVLLCFLVFCSGYVCGVMLFVEDIILLFIPINSVFVYPPGRHTVNSLLAFHPCHVTFFFRLLHSCNIAVDIRR